MCEWGVNSPWQWGAAVGNSWRTDADITPSWDGILRSLDNGAAGLGRFAGPGAWNDPDMLEVGVGQGAAGGRLSLTLCKSGKSVGLGCMTAGRHVGRHVGLRLTGCQAAAVAVGSHVGARAVAVRCDCAVSPPAAGVTC